MIQIAGHYVRIIDAVNRRIGRMMMYGIFIMVAILLWSSISKTFFLPSRWTLEVAQFAMVAYYILGGPYSLQMGSNVRMDLFYGEWSDRKKAQMDAFTVLFLFAYLGILLYGAIDSTAYSLGAPYKMDSFEFFGRLIGAFFTGSLLIETIFSLDGLGLLSYESVLKRDYPVVLATLYLFTLLGLFAKLLADISYVMIDPRIHFDSVDNK